MFFLCLEFNLFVSIHYMFQTDVSELNKESLMTIPDISLYERHGVDDVFIQKHRCIGLFMGV